MLPTFSLSIAAASEASQLGWERSKKKHDGCSLCLCASALRNAIRNNRIISG